MTTVDVVAVTHRGRVRTNNEDTILVGPYLSNALEGEPVRVVLSSPRPQPCVVADGLGGHAEGGRASLLAARLLGDAWVAGVDEAAVQRAVQAADAAIHEEAGWARAWKEMGTTIAGLVFHDGRVLCVNVGDSRCYQYDDGVLVQLSQDDSPPPPAGASPDWSPTVVTQTLGGGAAPGSVRAHVHNQRVEPGDRFLICSDGLTDCLTADAIEKVLGATTDPTGAVRALLAEVLRAGAPDNVSIVLATVAQEEGHHGR
ncbi:PP2C family protein-serine/threonine phosphatase [Cryptosporangium aurantiacum]|uniref:Serine/threonine protein phosphatase PrpC n=1 Tax=Cryptosporangium aurantiacum TaxID=134849 RepID=A0A1M7R0L6_9ACTN|nr:protein phosphatase 2C domain-containing protein [Cryptosporangium aurantiacum]SHN38274.1 Serine/threonine protein phosphatase PrpC [Cryptosporangium aurantiacum]